MTTLKSKEKHIFLYVTCKKLLNNRLTEPITTNDVTDFTRPNPDARNMYTIYDITEIHFLSMSIFTFFRFPK